LSFNTFAAFPFAQSPMKTTVEICQAEGAQPGAISLSSKIPYH